MDNRLEALARLIRYYILLMTTTAGSGHTTSSLSAVELMTTLFFGEFFRADLDHPENPNNDRLIFSKGHASPLFYSLYGAAGKLTEKDLLNYRKFESPLEGHPTLSFPYTEAPTGSLGQGLSIGLGMALYDKRITKQSYRTFVLLGDGEMAEGSVWEAISTASYYKLDNLVAILDVNRLGQSQETMFGHDLSTYKNRVESFGWSVQMVDGHNLDEIKTAYKKLLQTSDERPKMLIGKTYKGHGISLLENKENWHGKPIPRDELEKAIFELGKVDLSIRGTVSKPSREISNLKFQFSNKIKNSKSKISYKIADSVATRQAAGDALTELMYRYPQIVCLDGDVKNSLYTETTQKDHFNRYFEMFIAEQNMADAAIGMWRRGALPFVTTFSAFMTRAFDQIRMAALAGANIKFIGSHAGVSIGEDGASQMGLEDMAMFRSVFGSTVLYPADAVATQKLVEEMVKTKGISYIRVARPATPVIYEKSEEFPVGGFKVHRLKSPKSKIIIIAAGITLYEALKAQEELIKENIEAVVVDLYSVKPVDEKGLRNLVQQLSSRPGLEAENRDSNIHIVTVEDHWADGGLGDAVLGVFAIEDHVLIHKLAVTKMPHSGKPAQLLEYEGIDAKGIVGKVRSL